MCFGHTHKPYHRTLHETAENAFTRCRHAINIGSAGKPKDGDPRGCYVLLTLNETSSITDKDSIQVNFIRFTYDVERAARAIETSPLPAKYADMLRKAT